MIPLLPFHGRELAALVAEIGRSIGRVARAPRVLAASTTAAGIVFVVAACAVYAQLLDFAPPRLVA